MYLEDSAFTQLAGILDNIHHEIEALQNIRLDIAQQLRTYFLQVL